MVVVVVIEVGPTTAAKTAAHDRFCRLGGVVAGNEGKIRRRREEEERRGEEEYKTYRNRNRVLGAGGPRR